MPLSKQQLGSLLWGMADTGLRGKVEDYKAYILSLLFFKRLSDNYEWETEKRTEQFRDQYGKEPNAKQLARLQEEGHAFTIPPGHFWADVRNAPMDKKNERLHDAVNAIAERNPALKGIINSVRWNEQAPDGSGGKRLHPEVVVAAMNHLDPIPLDNSNVSPDVLGDAYEYLIKKFADENKAGATAGQFADEYNVGYETRDGILVPILKSADEAPSFRQFLYVYYKHRNAAREAKGREGENSFELTGRATTGNSEASVFGPGVVAQIDWTTADIYLVSDENPNLIVGRPKLYGMKDVWARFLYSLVTTFETAGFWSGSIALENALADKVEYCADYGVTIEKDEWPVDFLPEQLIVDGGEFSTHKARHIVNGLGMRISILPPYRGDLKGIVERNFGLVKGQLISWLPGALPRLRKKDEKPSPLDGVLTVSEFRRLTIEFVLKYHKAPLKNYKPGGDVNNADIRCCPIELLNWGLKNRSGRMLRPPLEQSRLHLLPGGEATVTPDGVRFNKLFFTCDRAVTSGWYEKARRFGNYKILVAFDPRRAESIFLRGPKTTTLEPLFLTQGFYDFRTWTWAAIEEHFKNKRLVQQESNHQELQDKVRVQSAVRQIGDNAKARKKAALRANPPESKAAKLQTIPENQKQMREQERVASLRVRNTLQTANPPAQKPENIVPLCPTDEPARTAPAPTGVEKAMLAKLAKLKESNGRKV